MSFHLAATLAFGALALATAWLPIILRQLPLSLPLLAIAFGAAFGAMIPMQGLAQNGPVIEPLLEYVLVIAVMGAGLKIDRPFQLSAWGSTWRLLVVAMPISIALVAVVAHVILGFPPALALLAGAILSPTDPVLASEVQAGPPGIGEEGEVRFALTSEAGLNDGLAMPFVVLAVALLTQGGEFGTAEMVRWIFVDVVYAVVAGAALGGGCGWGLIALNRRLPEALRLSASRDGLAVLGVSLLVYGLASLIHVNGFVAVFATAVAFRNVARSVDYARDLYTFGDQIERLAMALVMAGFGALLANGLLGDTTLGIGAVAALALFAARPISVLVGAFGSVSPAIVRGAIGYFGIRGIGSFFYLAYALNRVALPDPSALTALVAVTVLASVTLYGVTSSRIMSYLDEHREAKKPIYHGPTLGEDEASG